MHNQRGFTINEVLLVAIIALGLGGWIANVVKLIGSLDGGVTAMLIARCVGVFAAPFGAILGYF